MELHVATCTERDCLDGKIFIANYVKCHSRCQLNVMKRCYEFDNIPINIFIQKHVCPCF